MLPAIPLRMAASSRSTADPSFVVPAATGVLGGMIRSLAAKRQLHATLILDAIGGELTGRLVDTAPFGSTILLYSNMSE